MHVKFDFRLAIALLLESIVILAYVVLLQTAIVGDVNWKFGLFKFRSHGLFAPALAGIAAFLLRRAVVERLFAPFVLESAMIRIWNGIVRQSHHWTSRFIASRAFRLRVLGGVVALIAALIGLNLLNPLKPGVMTAYYENADWSGKPFMLLREPFQGLKRIERNLLFQPEEFSVEWNGYLRIQRAGVYELTVVSDEYAAIWVNHQLLAEHPDEKQYQVYAGVIELPVGNHVVRLRYRNTDDMAQLKVFLSPPNKRTEQKGLSFEQVNLFAASPSASHLRVGQMCKMLALVLKLLLFACCAVALLVALIERQMLFPHGHRRFVFGVIFSAVLITHFFFSPITTPFDSRWTLHTTVSLLQEGNADLDEYRHALRANDFYSIEQIDGHAYTKYPIGASLVALPFMALITPALEIGLNTDIETVLNRALPDGIEKGIASCVVALIALLLFRISEMSGVKFGYSLLLVGIFAFGTSAWSTASRALWQHTPSMLMLTLIVYVLLRARIAPTTPNWIIALLGLPVAFSFVIRPTNSIVVLVISAYMLFAHRKAFFAYCTWGLNAAAPFIWYNLHTHHAILPSYYLTSSHFDDPKTPFFEALAGILISPSRGLFIYSPILLFALYGIALKIRARRWNVLDSAAAAMIALHTLLLTLFPCWWGGHSYGPRLFCDMIPLFCYFLIPLFLQPPTPQTLTRQFRVALFAALLAISVLIHARGVMTWDVYEWNTWPEPVEQKLWDWEHPQFLR
ncbi:putative membrane protein [Candidatus Moduliflexus flocculans]|uniref:Putative membrane protein n=1 Tax=Candidatus Moduliflexus flocculans TaxID=1499966 RepID=A0A0S6VXG8_9BACT|nr:putative membrane protein [Candidatus Moduliflexus flocculans]